MPFNSNIGSAGCGPVQVVFVGELQVGQVHLHGFRCHEWEPGVGAVLREVVGQGTQEKTSKHTSEASTVRISLAIVKAPSGHVMRCIVVSKEPVPSGEGNSVTQDSTADSVS
jgi:hypothetical protein